MTGSDDIHELAQRIATSVKEQHDDSENSRRTFLRRSALAGGSLLALGGGTGAVLAQTDGEEEPPEKPGAMFDDVLGTDVDVLNYALTLEHLEDVFYREVLEMFGEEDFVGAEALTDVDEATRREAYTYVESAGQHETTHVEVLTQAVEILGGDPVPEATYEFGVASVGDALALGQVLENTGVGAYAGAAPFIESPDLLSAALSIHSVEARHAAFMNQLNGAPPAPAAFDEALSQSEVLEAVGPLIVAPAEGDGSGGDGSGGDGNGTATPTPTGNGTATPTPTGNGTATPGGNQSG